MKIKTVDEKPMVIHRKKNPRIHFHNGRKAVRHKKVTNAVTVSGRTGEKTGNNSRETTSQKKEEGGWKERADSSIKVKNQRLKTFASVAAGTMWECKIKCVS